MKIMVLGPRNRYLRYAPDFAASLPLELVFEPDPEAEILFADPIESVNQALLDTLPNLKLIQSEGVAFHNFDLAAAAARNIPVCNCKGANAASVAEHTVMLMLMALRYGIAGHEAVRAGRQYEMKQQVMASDAPELGDCTVGLIGFGDIARETAKRLRPFGCKLCYYSLHRKSSAVEEAFGLTYLPLEQLAGTCDILSLHCAVNDQTRNLVDKQFLLWTKPGAILINTARGELMDNEAVRQALEDGRLSGLAADTLYPEPTPGDHPLVQLPQVILSPHLGGNTGSAFRRAHRIMWENARAILEGTGLQNVVNGI